MTDDVHAAAGGGGGAGMTDVNAFPFPRGVVVECVSPEKISWVQVLHAPTFLSFILKLFGGNFFYLSNSKNASSFCV